MPSDKENKKPSTEHEQINFWFQEYREAHGLEKDSEVTVLKLLFWLAGKQL